MASTANLETLGIVKAIRAALEASRAVSKGIHKEQTTKEKNWVKGRKGVCKLFTVDGKLAKTTSPLNGVEDGQRHRT
ncbi:hypothetical protein OF158_01015 [Weizmannia sp. WK01]|uniref:hypothetical protein n=1 Tax=Weizmannia sp. WK01 TaxID=2984845 RepID=UPI0021F808A0|nr:hypothetical protein [Weizmannia sp. WK01]UYT05029.1 hypothetical protein OF158_01015 [Weizmannia sp. WK01]